MKLIHYILAFFILFSASCTPKKAITVKAKIKLNPTYNFVLYVDKNIGQKYKDKIFSDLKEFEQINLAAKNKLQISLKRINKTITDLIELREVREVFDLTQFHFIGIFYLKNNNIYYKGYNLITEIIDDFDISSFLEIKDQNWLLTSQTGWLFIDSKKHVYEAFVNYKLVGYLPLLTCLSHGTHRLSVASYGKTVYERDIKIPQETAIDLGYLAKNAQGMPAKEGEIDEEDKGQAIFLAVISFLTLVSGIVIPIIVF